MRVSNGTRKSLKDFFQLLFKSWCLLLLTPQNNAKEYVGLLRKSDCEIAQAGQRLPAENVPFVSA
jgi:hypothetical protein